MMQDANILGNQFGHFHIVVSVRLPHGDNEIYEPARSLN